MYRRYLKLEPTHAEEFIAYLKIKQLWGEAARVRTHATYVYMTSSSSSLHPHLAFPRLATCHPILLLLYLACCLYPHSSLPAHACLCLHAFLPMPAYASMPACPCLIHACSALLVW